MAVEVSDPAPTPEDVVVRGDMIAQVAGAIGRLPDGQREAVELFYLRS